ncbi:uncharacterized protein LOC103704320 isoform X2 [Phoenix dactylifera]|uniref:Uncharacterized protein LOC103704320 isoform X2 n=1 Tax=Phoenix dactylifera TaxID=42345 RepID=A0A8B9AVZ4_PHODC|nr:uncharacterized protein LOC103704320 isoform X2 [Phoenix dactylifera]
MDRRGVTANITEAPPVREVIRSEDTAAAAEAIMSALVCGKRSSSVFEELPHTPPPSSKRIRCSAAAALSSPLQPSLSPSSSVNHSENDSGGELSSPIAHLRFLFPEMDPQILQRALEACSSNMDAAIKSLNELQSGAAGRNFCSASSKASVKMGTNILLSSEARNSFSAENLPPDGSGWIELFVREMMNASHVDDARSRTSRVLELLEKSIKARRGAEAAYSFQEESKKLKEQVEALLRENTILKRAVAIQNERQKDCEAGNQELAQLKQMVSRYQEQLRTLELNNYTLAMHLKQALQNSTIRGNFDHDVF